MNTVTYNFISHISQPALTYEWLLGWLNGETDRPLGKHTNLVLYPTTKALHVIFYRTVIMRIAPENIIELNTGGFWTDQTKACMNAYLPKGVRIYKYQDKWYIKAANGIFAYEKPKIYVDAKDGTVLNEPAVEGVPVG